MNGSPTRGLAIYGGSAFLVYMETGGFVTESPVLSTIPFLILSAFTLFTNMHTRVKYLTAASFLCIGLGSYFFSSTFSSLSLATLLVTIGHTLYTLALRPYVKEWSTPLIALCSVLFSLFFFLCFSDLVISIPSLVILLSGCVGSSLVIVTISGSILHYGTLGDVDDSPSISCVRLLGAALDFSACCLMIIEMFGKRSQSVVVVAKIIFYISQALLFLANERAF